MTEQTKQLSADEQREIFRRFLYETRLTLVAFGKLCGLTNPMLSMFENGKRGLSDKAWVRVYDAMEKVAFENRANLEIRGGALHAAIAALDGSRPDSALARVLSQPQPAPSEVPTIPKIPIYKLLRLY